tara:strand:- start:67 stop:594 length:528 start_codon:yes stop_codon:yes gene_type:complete
MTLNRTYKNQLEKCVGELPVEQWQELANVLKILFKEDQERASKDTRVFERKWFDIIEKNGFAELMFPSCSVLKALGETLNLEDKKLGDTGSSSDPLVAAYLRLLAGSLNTISIALENLRMKTKHWNSLDTKELFAKWIECADDAHAEWILTAEFSKDFGKLSNFYISNISKEMRP